MAVVKLGQQTKLERWQAEGWQVVSAESERWQAEGWQQYDAANWSSDQDDWSPVPAPYSGWNKGEPPGSDQDDRAAGDHWDPAWEARLKSSEPSSSSLGSPIHHQGK